ncbi:hypothetical protein E4U09_004602 [Claviceps aff. purpurea]|uniref:Uncharacterized protein n=1 Tax=Claviceps aff. purpurea TaxID=1967640 RepID=A0A9P7U195_9HYPO|nr:hypothetical protein E4U09_004602 [Claviceps aff. purpurea]
MAPDVASFLHAVTSFQRDIAMPIQLLDERIQAYKIIFQRKIFLYLPTEDGQQERVERTTVVCYKLPTKQMPKICIGRNLGRTGASASRRTIELASRLQKISP